VLSGEGKNSGGSVKRRNKEILYQVLKSVVPENITLKTKHKSLFLNTHNLTPEAIR